MYFVEITTLIDAVQNYTANANKLRSKISRLRFHILVSVYWKIPRYFQFLFFSGTDLIDESSLEYSLSSDCT